MKKENIKRVDLGTLTTTGGTRKFIITQLQKGGEFIRSYANCEYHAEMFELFSHEVAPTEAGCIGGGKIAVDLDQKTITLFGTSTQYGNEPDREKTKDLIKKAYPDFRIFVSS